MTFYKCKNSVFCAFFLLFFTLGTISGTFAFCCFFIDASWKIDCGAFCSIDPLEVWIQSLLSAVRALGIITVFALHPRGHRAVFALVFVRGFLIAYWFAALIFSDSLSWYIFIRELVVMVLFYSISKWVYFRWELSSHRCV